MRLVRHLTALAVLGLAAVSARSALAACTTDADCSAGFMCDVVGESAGCTGAPPCPPGEACPDPVCTEPVVELGCVPAPCRTNTDCPADMVCYAFVEECSSAPCVSPDACPEPTCTPTTDQRCVPRWVLPLLEDCATDTDCGAGFRCAMDALDCACGSGRLPAPTGGASGDPLPPATGGTGGSCTCETAPAVVGYCELVIQACTISDTCPPGWTCEANPAEGDCLVTPIAGTGGASAEPLLPPECPPPDPARICVPPYGLELGLTDLPTSDDESAPPPPLGTGGGRATGGPSAGGTATGTPSTAGAGPAPGPESGASSGYDGGCQLAPARGALGAAPLLGLLAGLAFLGGRRRRRA